MASLMSNRIPNTDRSRSRRKKKSHSMTLHQSQNGTNDQNKNQMIDPYKWKSSREERNYTSKLIQALRHVRTNNSTPSTSRNCIREAADRVLAVAAKGTTRWSRAILTNKLKLKFIKAKKPRVLPPFRSTKVNKASIGLRLNAKKLNAVQKKAHVLGNLVPGCRKQPLPVILEEAHDYISALEMQVRAMTALAELLTVAGALAGGSEPTARPPAAP